MKTIKQILEEKGSDIWSVSPDDTVYKAVALMSEKDIGALLVIQDGNLCGLLSERDYTRKIMLKNRTSQDTLVKEIMTSEVSTAIPSDTIQECMAVMTNKRFRHLPVTDAEDNNVLGMISIGDLVKSIIEEQRFVIDQLESYISS